MSVLRPIGWILFVLGVILLGADLLPAVLHHAAFRPISLDGFIDRSGVIRPAIAIIERLWGLLDYYALRPGFRILGDLWAFAVFVVAGAILLTLTGGIRRRH
ncbi:MAG TPA: hypothetical protein VL574_11370 [Stellaceae bacterium]|jgi:hypothetical protein|nr:hypothetical protein [Stellaceae bacterium]